MRRRELEDYIKKFGFEIIDSGGTHAKIMKNGELKSTLPRHEEIRTGTALEICKQLEIPKPNFR